jgi:hypothetical protein
MSASFVGNDQIAISGLASGTAILRVTLEDNSTTSTTVTVSSACSPPTASSSDRIFDWAEANFRHLLESPGAVSQSLGGYYYRYYPTTQTYVGTKDGTVWYLDGYTGALLNVGSVEAILQMADDAGY